MQTTLYDYWRSSASYRVRIALNFAGISFDSVPVNLLTGEQISAENRARNPQGLVPTLMQDGLTLTQSLAIIEYLNDTGAHQFLPEDPAAKAHVRALSYAIAMEIHPVCNLSVAKFAVSNSEGGISMESWMQHFISNGLSAFENMLTASGEYCFGDTPGMADLCLVPQLYNAARWGVDLAGMPKTSAIGQRLANLPEVEQAHPDHFAPDAT
jgi:maleylacetoacetate isomerase